MGEIRDFMLCWVEDDFNKLAEEYEGTASNTHLMALGTEDGEEAGFIEACAEAQRYLAGLLRKAAENPEKFLELLEDM